MVEPLPPTRRRSFSFGGLPRNRVSPSMRLVSFPQLSPKRASDNPRQRSRSKSMEKPSLRSGSHRTQPFHLRLVFNTVSRDVEFVGSSLEDLRYLINSSFSYLPVVRVCIEHPSIPNHMVPITDMDQLYDNAVVFLIPATSSLVCSTNTPFPRVTATWNHTSVHELAVWIDIEVEIRAVFPSRTRVVKIIIANTIIPRNHGFWKILHL